LSISLDHAISTQILFEEAKLARSGDSTDTVENWKLRVARLGDLCPHGKSATLIAALGTAILAKATELRIDVYSLLDRGETENSYSARSLADNVWARYRAKLRVDLGANGINPLNNTPFIGKTSIHEISGVRNREGWDFFIESLEALATVTSSGESRQVLRGFILARSRSIIPSLEFDPEFADNLTEPNLAELIASFVREESEGGRRAQDRKSVV